MVAVKFSLTNNFLVNKCSWALDSGTGAGATFTIGFHTSSKLTNILQAKFDASITTVQSLTVTSTLMLKGTYYYSFTTSSTTAAGVGSVNTSTGSMWANGKAIVNSNSVKIGLAANGASSGNLPGALGALTSVGILWPVCLWES